MNSLLVGSGAVDSAPSARRTLSREIYFASHDLRTRGQPSENTRKSGGLGSDDELNALLDRVRVVSMTRVLDRLGVERPTSLAKLSVYGWVSFVENVTAEWTSTTDVSPAELVDLLLVAFSPVRDLLLPDCSVEGDDS